MATTKQLAQERQEKMRRVVAAVRCGLTIESAAGAAGISVRTVARWRAKDAAFDRQVKAALADRMTPQEAVRRLDEIVRTAEALGETDVDQSDMDGPFEDPKAIA
ncbi:hypothetical protein [Candidatus Poriferisodalis sp.]|uniref:hypothetical protein n=1 Tax=Candidatus Poriferisodalis sp. TaxID=3101277 RepID=UPI003B01F36F